MHLINVIVSRSLGLRLVKTSLDTHLERQTWESVSWENYYSEFHNIAPLSKL